MPDMLEQQNNSKSHQWFRRHQRFILCSTASTGLICATSISLSTKETVSASFLTGQEDRLGNQQITGWLLWSYNIQSFCSENEPLDMFVYSCLQQKKKLQSYYFLEGRKLGNFFGWTTNDYTLINNRNQLIYQTIVCPAEIIKGLENV